MSWQLLITINIFVYAVTTLLQRTLAKAQTSKPIAYAIFFQLLTGVFAVILAAIFHAFSFPKITVPILFSLILGTFLYGFANLFIFKALKTTEASKFTVIYSSRAFFAVIASTIVLGELFSFKELIGGVFIFVGIFIVSAISKRATFSKGDLYSIIAAILFGFANANARYLLHFFSVYTYMVYVFTAPTLLLAVIYPKEAKEMKIFLKPNMFKHMFILVSVWTLATLTFFLALQKGPSTSLISTIQLLSVIVTVILSIIFLHERTHIWRKLLGALISFIGLIILSL